MYHFIACRQFGLSTAYIIFSYSNCMSGMTDPVDYSLELLFWARHYVVISC